MVRTAERELETSDPKKARPKNGPFFSKELRKAYQEHVNADKKWRKSGRPTNSDDPSVIARKETRARLQKVRKDETNNRQRNINDDLMDTHRNISNGSKGQNNPIDFIDTLVGRFSGENVLEGFAANIEELNSDRKDMTNFDNEFYKMCIEDNMIIFDFTSNQHDKIPIMTIDNLKKLIFSKLKLNKACDVYKLTVEHIRNAGPTALNHILTIINLILDDINNMSCPELKTALGTIIYKGRGKPVNHHKSYRTVRVTPLLGRIIDEYLRPATVAISRPMQDKNQYGFTEDMSYLLGAIQRYECQKHAQDTKANCFTCTLGWVLGNGS